MGNTALMIDDNPGQHFKYNSWEVARYLTLRNNVASYDATEFWQQS